MDKEKQLLRSARVIGPTEIVNSVWEKCEKDIFCYEPDRKRDSSTVDVLCAWDPF